MLTEAKELQELLGIAARGKGLKPIEQSALARVWKELGEFRLRLQGKGPPKAVDYGAKKAKRSAPAKGFTESAEAKAPKLDTTTGSGSEVKPESNPPK